MVRPRLLALAVVLVAQAPTRPASAQLGMAGAASGSLEAKGRGASYGPPSPTASFLYWDLIVGAGIGVLLQRIEADGTSASDAAIGWVRAGPQLALVDHRVILALRTDYEYSNLSRATLGTELDAGGLVNENTYAGVYAGGDFDLDGALDAAHTHAIARAGLRTGLTAGPFAYEFDYRSFPRPGLYAETVMSVTFTLSYDFFEATAGFPPLPGRTIARFED